MIRLRDADPEQLAVLGEDVADVLGNVREEVADVGVLGYSSAGQLCTEAVDRPATVGVDEASDQEAWMGVREL